MRIVGLDVIDAFASKHPDSRPRLEHWINAVRVSERKTPADVRRTFGTASFVGRRTVFDIGGGKFRLIALITYRVRIISVEQVLTHKGYDKGSWK